MSQPEIVPEEQTEEKNMTFLEHLEELRGVLVRSGAAVILCCIPFFFFQDFTLGIIERLLPEEGTLQVLGPIDKFTVIVKMSVFFGLFSAFPYVLFQIWRFVAPGLYVHEKKAIMPFISSGWLLFLTGISFCYLIVLPFSLQFLWEYGSASSRIVSNWELVETSHFCVNLLLGFGLAFNLPVILVSLCMMGILSRKSLIRARPYCFLASFVVGAVLTPQDVFSMLLMAVPLYILYEGSLLAMYFVERGRTEEPV